MPKRRPALDTEQPEELDLRSRGDGRRANAELEEALARLARELVSLSPGNLAALGVSESLNDTVRDARALTSLVARNRQLRLVRSELRNADWGALRARLETLQRHGAKAVERGAASEAAGRAEGWVVRLLGEGGDAVEALITECPSVDRTHLWTLIRQARKSTGDRRKKAEQRLAQAVASSLRAPASPNAAAEGAAPAGAAEAEDV
jgi:ribosome-associated protein